MRLSAPLFLVCAAPHSAPPSQCAIDAQKNQACRNVPGTRSYPTNEAWNSLNATIGGRLVNVVPTAKRCETMPGGACTDAQWSSALFRSTIPGSLNWDNWEQDYDLNPPSVCLRKDSVACGQGNVPLYSVEAQSAADIQTAVKFANANNLRVAVKCSGHDYLGRSTAPNSLLIRTTGLDTVSMTDAFFVGEINMGSAVTVGSGLTSQALTQTVRASGKVVVSGNSATVCPAAGYVQGGGHSPIAPIFGLASDNVLEFHVVVASGELLQVNAISHPDLFYALRGGGAGSWGVIVSATFRTFPTFELAFGLIELTASSNAAAGALAALHAEHVFDVDAVRGSQYPFVFKTSETTSLFWLWSYMANTTAEEGKVLLAPFLNAALALPGITLVKEEYVTKSVNDVLYQPDDIAGGNVVLGSRLIPAAVYRDSPATVGKVYEELLNAGTPQIVATMVAGGQVTANADISSAVHPAWRTAKGLLLVGNVWNDDTPLVDINALRRMFQTTQLPIIEQLSGLNGASYSNEGDVLEPHFQATFFGPNYEKLSKIKTKYDPTDLFIVPAGVGSERWDQWGFCPV
ncbi:FAD-binding domain-containing protein [Mycena crocata]|nr:FAD-binding domain-containing protein [Mycena crocata]